MYCNRLFFFFCYSAQTAVKGNFSSVQRILLAITCDKVIVMAYFFLLFFLFFSSLSFKKEAFNKSDFGTWSQSSLHHLNDSNVLQKRKLCNCNTTQSQIVTYLFTNLKLFYILDLEVELESLGRKGFFSC